MTAQFARFIRPVPERTVRLAVNVAMVAVILWLLVVIGLQIWGNRLALNLNLPVQANLLPRERWTWFARGTQPEVAGTFGELPEASLRAELLGVVISGAQSTATMVLGNNQEAVYRIGDKLGSGVEIREVEPFRVIVWQNGQLKQIPLNKAGGDSRGDDAAILVETGQPDAKGFSLAGMFDAVPIRAERYGTGFRLRDLSDEFVALTELQSDDVVVQVDGKSMNEMMSDPTLWMGLMKETQVSVIVLRDGREEELSVNAASLSTRVLPRMGPQFKQ